MAHADDASANPQPSAATRPSITHTFDLSELRLLRQTLNLVDYGMVVVDADSGTVQFANAQGQAALQAPGGAEASLRPGHGLRMLHGRVIAYRPSDTEQLRRALGLRMDELLDEVDGDGDGDADADGEEDAA